VRIAVCNVGLGNLRSVERALDRAARESHRAVTVEVTAEPDRVRSADKVVVPGQGSFGGCARALHQGLGQAVRERIAWGAPYLGVCLGLQVLFQTSEEAPGCAGLGIIEGSVVRLRGGVDEASGAPLKIPHMGWNVVEPAGPRGLLPREPTHFYFVHGFAVVPREPSVIAGTTEYGHTFVSAVSRGNVFACQFHPEKSQRAGLSLLQRFVEI
jgi:glutamine amidotransferase